MQERSFFCLFMQACAMLLCLTARSFSVPSFARQMDVSCLQCHYAYPQLNEYGRTFKIRGYVTDVGKNIKNGKKESDLSLVKIPPLATAFVTSLTATGKEQPGIQNGSAAFPQELSIFMAGKVTSNIGSFLQLSYEQEEGNIGMDMGEIRLAFNSSLMKKPLTYGFILNNTPALQDVWNSTPAFAFPYLSSETAPTPIATVLIDNVLGNEVAGLGMYGFFDNQLYLGGAVYRSAPQGGFPVAEQPAEGENTPGIISGVAPYWRAAVQPIKGSQYLEIGTYGMFASLYPSGVSGTTNKYTDLGFDGQYELHAGPGSALFYLTGIYEWRTFNASLSSGEVETAHPNLFSLNFNMHYFMNFGLEGSFGYILTAGNTDSLLYNQEMIRGSRTNKPNNGRFILQLSYLPWQNAKVTVQGYLYHMFNGASENYDGFGRNASDNNTLYVSTWLAF